MIIKQHRIQSIKHLSMLPIGTKFVILVSRVSRFPLELNKFGFTNNMDTNTRILPCIFNIYSWKNAERYFTIDRSLPKEKYYQTVYWTRTEWAGRGETREVTDFTDIPRERYHRDYNVTFSVGFTLTCLNGEKAISSDELLFSEENYEKIINSINMILSVFGECEIKSDVINETSKVINLTWEVLPKGNYPWSTIKKTIDDMASKNTTQKKMMLRNCELINSYKPDFIAYGRAGFKGYVVFGFYSKNLYFFESIIPDNATYVFENEWEALSKLSKAEILSNDMQKDRLIHRKNWDIKFNEYMEDKHG